MALLLAAMAAATAAGGRPNTSLATVPVGYFGGNTLHRGDANIAMLAKLRCGTRASRCYPPSGALSRGVSVLWP